MAVCHCLHTPGEASAFGLAKVACHEVAATKVVKAVAKIHGQCLFVPLFMASSVAWPGSAGQRNLSLGDKALWFGLVPRDFGARAGL